MQRVDTFLLAHKRLPTVSIVFGCFMLCIGLALENDRVDAARKASLLEQQRQAAADDARRSHSITSRQHDRQPTPAPPDLRDKLSRLTFSNEDPHTCEKSDDVYFAKVGDEIYGAEGPVEAPTFLFNTRHDDNTINWADGFKGKVPVCFLIDEKGIPVNVTFPQPPAAPIQEHLKERISGWRYKPGRFPEMHKKKTWLPGDKDVDQSERVIKCQVAFGFTFQ